MAIENFNCYRIDPILKTNADTDFIKKESNSFNGKSFQNNKNNNKENTKSFSEIFNQCLTGKNK